MVKYEQVLKWMEYIRNNPENAYRFSENFWDSQVRSKKWLLNHIPSGVKNIHITGGWYGILGQIIAEAYPESTVLTTDVDQYCQEVFDQTNIYSNLSFDLFDMEDGISGNYDLLINTATEHVCQSKYDSWWRSIPRGTKYIIQSASLVIDEHIRIPKTLPDFININHMENADYVGHLRCGHFYRFMGVGIK